MLGLQDGKVRVVYPDAVSNEGAAVEGTQTVEDLGGAELALGPHVVVLFASFREMDEKGGFVLIGKGSSGFHQIVRHGVRCVRGDGWGDEGVVGVALEKRFGAGQGFGLRLRVSYRKPDHGLAEHTAHTALFGCLGDDVFEVVHVGVRRSAG